MLNENVCLKDLKLQDFRLQARSKAVLIRGGRAIILARGSPAAARVLNDNNVSGGSLWILEGNNLAFEIEFIYLI